MELSSFSEKLNKTEGVIYTVEEKAVLYNGVYEAALQHDNVKENTISVYTGSKLTGSSIETWALSTPSTAAWKKIIRIYADVPEVYISYETVGDTVEAEDINNVQEAVINTQSALNFEIGRATGQEKIIDTLIKNLNSKKADIESPALTGVPKAPTASAGTSTTQIATTAFVQTAVSNHNISDVSHSDIRDLISVLTTRLNALADSDDTTLDQLSEIVAYIKSNRTLIENVTTNKVNVTDIIDNLTSTAANKPLSAKQGKVLNDLITAFSANLSTVATSGSYTDLINKPAIPSVGNGTITITQNGITKGTFTTNQNGNTTIALTDNNTTYSVATQSIAGLESAADKTKLDNIESGAEVNQNAFSSVVVGSTTIAADNKTDTLTLAGNNVTLIPDTTNDKITIGITQANVINALGFSPGTGGITLGNTGNSVTYTAFARTSSTGTLGECTGTFILTDCGNYGGALAGVWLIQISNKGSTPMMSVTTLNSNKAGTVEFGCYESGEYFYFGVCCPPFRATVKLITLNKVQVETADYGDSSAKPNGWTVVTPRVLQDDSKIKEINDKFANYLPLSGGRTWNQLMGV